MLPFTAHKPRGQQARMNCAISDAMIARNTMDDTRLQALEEMAAELLKTTDELSDVIARQEREIAVLTHRVQMLMSREGERDAQGGGGIVIGDERPPHY